MEIEWYMQMILLVVLVFASLEDIRTHSIRVDYPVAFLFGGIVKQCICRELSWQMFFGGLFFGLAFMILSHFYKDMIGSGDGLILCVCGTYLGFTQVAVLFARAIFLAAVWGIFVIGKQMVLTGRRGRKELAFLPFLLLAYGSVLVETKWLY